MMIRRVATVVVNPTKPWRIRWLFFHPTFSISSAQQRLQTTLTREEAGRWAQHLALQQQHQQEQEEGQQRHHRQETHHMDTLLSHAGISTHEGNHHQQQEQKQQQQHSYIPLARQDHHHHNVGMSPPLHFATTYTRPSDGDYWPTDSIYARADNPTRRLFEREMAQLECHDLEQQRQDRTTASSLRRQQEQAELKRPLSEQAVSCAFASGMMAASAIVLAHATPVSMILPHDLYHGVPTVLHTVFARFGNVQVHSVDMTNVDRLQNQIHDKLEVTKSRCNGGENVIVWMETPSNPQTHILDICQICNHIKQLLPQCTTVVDSTLAPPTLQQPLSLGADVVMHSVTKFLGGHSDVTAGVVTTNPITERGRTLGPIVQQIQIALGGVASPMDCWLALRGLRTLAVRVDRQCHNAREMAQWFRDQQQGTKGHGGQYISAIHYPGLTTHPQHNLANQQMKQFGGILSVEFTSETAAFCFAGALQVLHRATSLGGTESLVEHRASIEPPERRVSPPGLVRLSAGLEHTNDLLHDLEHALDIVHQVMLQHNPQGES